MNHYLEQILAPRESIRLTLREHWFLIVQDSLVALIVMVAIVAMQLLIAYLQPNWPVWLVYFLLLIPLFIILRSILRWRSTLIALTNRRVLRLSGIIEKHIGEISLGMIDSVEISQGPVEKLIGFGDIRFMFKETGGTITFFKIENPNQFKLVFTSLPQAKPPTATPGQESQVADISKGLNELNTLYQKGIITRQEYHKRKALLLKHYQ